MKKFFPFFLLILLIFPLFAIFHTRAQAKNAPTICVLPGLDPEKVFDEEGDLLTPDPFAGYKTIVIDAQFFTPEQIDQLHQKGHTIYSYLNIGSLETSRSDYPEYKDLCLAPYENWPNEYWSDVTDGRWQDRCSARGNELIAKGVDGFFVDNTDVYYQYKTKRVKHCIDAILKRLRKKTTLSGSNPQIMLNGGDVYVTAKLKEKKADRSFTAVCQESVYNQVADYKKPRFVKRSTSSKKYYLSYLKTCRKAGLSVLVLDYVGTSRRMKDIRAACKKAGFSCYLSKSLTLDTITPIK